MAKKSYSPQSDQFDPKIFRESLGTFGTTTRPGANQLTELQAKVREGVKHVELHLAGTGKGQFGQQDVPDKYGFEQRRTIMQLAKLNSQSLSVHGSFDVTSFSGLGQGGFNESQRWVAMKEIDETLKFAAETAKGGAVVFHIQGDPIATNRGELNLSKRYLDWLEKNKPDEYKKLKQEYFSDNPLNRTFVDNPEQEKEVREKFEDLKSSNKSQYDQIVSKAKKNNREPWEEFYISRNLEKVKVSPDMNPLIVVGDKITPTDRQAEFIDLSKINDAYLTDNDREVLKNLDLDLGKDLTVEDFQKINAIFTNGIPSSFQGKVSEEQFNSIKDKILVTYDKVLKNNDNLQAQADKEFYHKLIQNQISVLNIQKKDLDENYQIYKDYLDEIKNIKIKQKEIYNKQLNAKSQEEKSKLDQQAQKLRVEKYQLEVGGVGQLEYQKLERYDELIADINEKVRKLSDQKNEIKAITDEVFDRNTSSMGHLGIKALRYQLDLKKKSKTASSSVSRINSNIKKLQDEYETEQDYSKKNELFNQIQKEKYKLKKYVGLKDYKDIDLVDRPLYLAPENMLPGMGSLTSLEEYKAAIRMSQEDFAKKILSEEPEYKNLREEYELETGIKIDSKDKAIELAKRHVSGTFDNAHAGAWLKHFKKEKGESEEHKIERFNKWLNSQAEDMVKEGIVKHVHFNDTQAKDDDHNLLGQGILDIHDLRQRLRKINPKTGKPLVNEALIVEAGGRRGHLMNALEIFSPSLFSDPQSAAGTGYKLNSSSQSFVGGQEVSDWMKVNRLYNNRPEYSQYGFNDNTFRHQGPPQGLPRGGWSGTGFL